jgi:predicted metal-binding transcription factor (methanogenesis marker protein 9)
MERQGIVHVKPINRPTWLPEGHDGEFRYTNCAEFLAVQMNVRTRTHNTGLEKDEETTLEKELKLEPGTLSPYNSIYWSSYPTMIPITRDGIMLDLANPKDYIWYKNLLVHSEVANSETEKYDSPEYRYVMTSPEQEAKVKNEQGKVRREAYKLFGKLSIDNMKDVLKLLGQRVSDDVSIDFVEGKITETMDENPQAFINLVKDKDFKMKVFVSNCIAKKAIIKNGPKYLLNGGDQIGLGIDEAIAYLSDHNNQDVYKSLKAKVEIDD